jgi:uncharacterized repeat protein (TIGR03803 family)
VNSHKIDATFLDRTIRSRRFPAQRIIQRAFRTLSCSLFLGFCAALLVAHTEAAPAQSESVLYSFCSMANCADGSDPLGNVILDETGNLYGTTASGGMVGGLCQSFGCGTVFEWTTSGTLKILYNFSGPPDGEQPMDGLIRDSKGNLYGTTASGGNVGGVCGTNGCGTVFELVKAGSAYTEKVLYAFKGGTDGAYPGSGLVRDAAGNLFGTTPSGGGSGCSSWIPPGCGTVFKITAAGNEEVLYSFTGNADGGIPNASLIRDGAGNLYGTTEYGGNVGGECPSDGCGVVFKVTPDAQEIVLYSFTGGDAGELPMAPLVSDGKGNVYGTTATGGTVTNLLCTVQENGCGVVFELTEKGSLRTVYTFNGDPTDGQLPIAGLVRDKQGNFYGTTDWGGPSNAGTVFKVSPSGVETVLHRFVEKSDGVGPHSSLAFDAKGNLYGTAHYGGAFGWGVLFKVMP